MRRKIKLFAIGLKARWKIIFWLTLALLLIFSATPKGYAQALPTDNLQLTTNNNDQGTSSETVGTSTESSAPASAPELTPIKQPVPESQSLPVEESTAQLPYKKKFIISSYYSPLPNQAHYFKGTYEKEVRLNGEGVHAADGTKVYPGMAAAPKNFPFGTKLGIPGIGFVAVHDRGGAIKNNRLDIWMGEGEEGLSRALGWGMRTVEVTVYGIDPNIQESVDFSGVPLVDLNKFLVQTEHFKSDLALEDNGEDVRELQRFLKKLGYFESEPTGYFGQETGAAVQKFQLDQRVIDSADDPGAGNFGPRSRMALEALLNNEKSSLLARLPLPTLKKGDKGENVKALQEILHEYKFLNEVSGVFDEQTLDAVFRFQLDLSLVEKKTDFGAGMYGPRTADAFKKIISGVLTPFTPLGAKPMASGAEVFSKKLALNDRGPEVMLLQEELKRLNFLGVEPTGYYGKITEHAVKKFQQAFDIVASEKDDGAGVTGPQTLAKLNELTNFRQTQSRAIAQTTEKKELRDKRVESERILVAGAIPADSFMSDLVYAARGTDVERLQKLLKRLGFFPGRLTTKYFGDITRQSVLAFQKNHGIEESGNLDDATRKVINKIVAGA
ncbi:peptidoglycan-binding protein [Candidatus Peregrinibacteria bacterium]|nr:peptidoglycan-binding protein [Candidatus Peregrinibacteria bacterium]